MKWKQKHQYKIGERRYTQKRAWLPTLCDDGYYYWLEEIVIVDELADAVTYTYEGCTLYWKRISTDSYQNWVTKGSPDNPWPSNEEPHPWTLMFKHINDIMQNRATHLEMYAAAFVKQMGTEEASKYQLTEIKSEDGFRTSWRFELK